MNESEIDIKDENIEGEVQKYNENMILGDLERGKCFSERMLNYLKDKIKLQEPYLLSNIESNINSDNYFGVVKDYTNLIQIDPDMAEKIKFDFKIINKIKKFYTSNYERVNECIQENLSFINLNLNWRDILEYNHYFCNLNKNISIDKKLNLNNVLLKKYIDIDSLSTKVFLKRHFDFLYPGYLYSEEENNLNKEESENSQRSLLNEMEEYKEQGDILSLAKMVFYIKKEKLNIDESEIKKFESFIDTNIKNELDNYLKDDDLYNWLMLKKYTFTAIAVPEEMSAKIIQKILRAFNTGVGKYFAIEQGLLMEKIIRYKIHKD